MSLRTIRQPGQARFSRVSARLAVSVLYLDVTHPARAHEGLSRAEDPVLFHRLSRIDQDKLLNGDYPLRQAAEHGRHLFSTPFTKAEGYGEGGRPDGKGGAETGP